jgi:hypothetical protein
MHPIAAKVIVLFFKIPRKQNKAWLFLYPKKSLELSGFRAVYDTVIAHAMSQRIGQNTTGVWNTHL